jgi:predicted NodU family carbamoyl transferase
VIFHNKLNDHKVPIFPQRISPNRRGFVQVFPVKEWRFVDHHEAHARMAFFLSPFRDALILSYDGGGNDGQIKPCLKKFKVKASEVLIV